VLATGVGFTPLFIFAAFSYLLALGWFQLFLPKVTRYVPPAEPAFT
jgi:MFS transporter, ACS family, hexuronate transporter